MKHDRALSSRQIALAGLLAALTAAGGWLSAQLPFSPVPVTGQTCLVLLSGFLLGARLGALCQAVYLLMGAAGVPVFSGFSAGPGVLAGPTGGFLVGFIPASYFCGLMGELRPRASFAELAAYALGGAALIYGAGVGWLLLAGYSPRLYAAVAIGVLPFLPGDVLKALLCAYLVPRLRRGISRPCPAPDPTTPSP